MSWLKSEFEKIEVNNEKREKDRKVENEKWRKDMGLNDIIPLNEGVTVVSIDLDVEPKVVETKFGDRHVIDTVDPEDKCILMSGYLYELFIKAIYKEKGIVKLNIVRTGTTKETTKYVIKMVS